MFQSKPFSINYLGKDGTYNFFVDIGNINEIIYGTSLYNTFIFPTPIGSPNFYTGVYDVLLERIENFQPVGNDGELNNYLAPLKTSVSLSTSGPIYLRIPKIPMGSGIENAAIRPLWFSARTDQEAANMLFWNERFEIVSTVDEDDFVYEQRYDNLQSYDSIIDFPKTKFPQKGAIYIKLADIQIDDDEVRIIPFFRSNVINPNRYITMGINYTRNCNVQFLGIARQGESNFSVSGYYSRPNWIIKTFEEIFSSAKSDIESDFDQYFSNWDYNDFGKIDSFEILQAFAIYTVYSNDKVRVRKLFENQSEELPFLELNDENLEFIIPGLDSSNSILEK